MDEFIDWVISALFWPYFWWRGHNQESTLGTSRDEEETENFWLKFAIFGTVVVLIVIAVHHFYPQLFPA